MARSRDDRTAGAVPAAVVVAVVAPFYLNDLASIFVTDWRWWLAIDYLAVKTLPLAVLGWLLASGRLTPDALGLARSSVSSIAWVVLVAALAGTLIDQNAYALLAPLPDYGPLGGMPAIGSDAWDWFDLTVGLLLVGFVEEVVFRALACHVIERFTRRAAAIVAISSVAFGLIHWSGGLHAVLVTAVIGAVFMAVYLRTRCTVGLALAHFAVNFVDFAGVIPKSVFRLVA